MATDLTWQLVSLRDIERSALVRATVMSAKALDELVLSDALENPNASSRAAKMRDTTVNRRTSQGDTHLDNANSMISSSCLAAADHMRAFAVSLRSKRTTVANWTIARGTIEALSRANYVLLAEDSAALLARYVALAHLEFAFAGHSTYVVRDAGVIDPKEYLVHLDEMLVELGIARIKPPRITEMASDLLESTAPGSGGRGRYSQLSAAAHGQSPALGMFRAADKGQLMLPRNLALEVVHMQIGCALAVGDRILRHFGVDGEGRVKWSAARRASREQLGIGP